MRRRLAHLATTWAFWLEAQHRFGILLDAQLVLMVARANCHNFLATVLIADRDHEKSLLRGVRLGRDSLQLHQHATVFGAVAAMAPRSRAEVCLPPSALSILSFLGTGRL